MAHDRQVFGNIVLIGFLVFGLMRVADVAPAAANEVLKWNETAVMAATAGGQDGIVTTRTLAMVHGAIHGSLNAINRRYAAYYFEAPAEVGAAPEAAVAAAAHTVLVGVLPSFGTPAQKIAALAIAEDAYMASLSHGSDAAAKTKLSASQFWLPGPPALTSQAYARDYEKVKSLGGQMSTARTAEQTEIARFWFEGPPAFNRIARVVAEGRGLNAWDSARLLALMNMTMADAFIAGFKIRYVYDLWRPVTAIREGDADGNDATVGDPNWNSLQNTPAVSDYPSTQSTFSGAAAATMAGVLGTDQVAFSVTSGPPFADIKRSFTSLAQVARESTDSRVYAGIHFPTACEDGLVLGRKIGERTVALYLQPVKK